MLAKLLAGHGVDLGINVIEIGAAPIEGHPEPFHVLPSVFPSARISAVEIDRSHCDELNRAAPAGMRYYPRALGKADETRTLYETADPLCTSLYLPDPRYSERFNNLDGQQLKSVTEVLTTSLDSFVHEEKLGAPDFLKMDIQGAELEVLEGGAKALESLLAIVAEASFVPMYRDQPLYGDLDAHLRDRGFMLHTFLGFGGRVMKPLAKKGMANYPVQMLWTDALFVKDVLDTQAFTTEQLLKLAVLLDLYESSDVAVFLLKQYDARSGTGFAQSYLQALSASPEWSSV